MRRGGSSRKIACGPPCNTVLPASEVPDGCIGGSTRGLRLQGIWDGVPATTVSLPSGTPGIVT